MFRPAPRPGDDILSIALESEFDEDAEVSRVAEILEGSDDTRGTPKTANGVMGCKTRIRVVQRGASLRP